MKKSNGDVSGKYGGCLLPEIDLLKVLVRADVLSWC